MPFARRRVAPAATSARPSSSSRASSGTRSSPGTPARASSAGASSSISGFRRASPASRARACSRRSQRSPIRTTSCWSRCRKSIRRRNRRRGSRRSRTPAPRSPSTRCREASCRAWLEARLARQKQRASPETLAFLADRCEGNLLAARQEIEKLGLALPEGPLSHDDVVRAVTDVARFDLTELSAAWLEGDAARAIRILASLEAEGEGAPLLVWQAGEDVHALAAALEAARSGSDVAAALRSARVWGKRSDAMALAARRVTPGTGRPSAARSRAPRRAREGPRPRQCMGRAALVRAGARSRARTTRARRVRPLTPAAARRDSLQIAPGGLQHGERGDARRFRAQDPRAETQLGEAARGRRVGLARGASAFRTDQERGRRRRRADRGKRRHAVGRQQESRTGPRGQPFADRACRRDVRNAIAAALLARGDDHLPPVREPLVARDRRPATERFVPSRAAGSPPRRARPPCGSHSPWRRWRRRPARASPRAPTPARPDRTRRCAPSRHAGRRRRASPRTRRPRP